MSVKFATRFSPAKGVSGVIEKVFTIIEHLIVENVTKSTQTIVIYKGISILLIKIFSLENRLNEADRGI